MSDMEAVKAKVKALEGNRLGEVREALKEMDEYSRYEWMYENNIYYVNEVLYEAEIEELDAYGFIDKQQNEDGSITITTLFYNGGTCIGEIIEDILRDEQEE